MTLLVGIIGYLALVPLGYLLWSAFFDAQGPTLRFFREAITQQDLLQTATTTLLFVLGTTTIATVAGCSLAYLVVRTDIPFKRTITVGALLPLIIPGVLHTIGWTFVLAPRTGLLNRLAEPLFGRPVFDIFSLSGMILAEGLHSVPLAFLLMSATFRSIDPSLEESALMSGADLRTVLRRITLPVAKPALVAVLLIIGLRTVEAFDVPAILGLPDRTWTFTSRIWVSLSQFPREFGPAAAYSVVVLALGIGGLALFARLTRQRGAFQTVGGRATRPRLVDLRRWRRSLTLAVLVYLTISVLLPLVMIVYAATQPFYQPPGARGLSNVSLDNFAEIFQNDINRRAWRNSLLLGAAAATFIMTMMATASWIVVRRKVRGGWLLDHLAFLPIVVPGIVLGTSLLFLYLRHPLPIYGTLWILLIAYSTKYMPYGMRFATNSMLQINEELEESAQLSGATGMQTFRRVVLPLLGPGIMAGWIYILIVAMAELSTSILIYSPGNEVLSVRIWDLWDNGRSTQLSALGLLMVTSLALLALVGYRLGSLFGLRQR